MTSQRNPNNFLPELIGPVNLQGDGTPVDRRRSALNFVGATLEDDPENDRTNVTLPGGGGGSSSTEHLAALRAKVGTTDKEVTNLLGSTAAGDDAGAAFWWDAASTAADDDGLVVKPTAIGGGSPGRWKRIHDGTHIHPKWFGAKGDGVTNDATALQAAVDACFAASPPLPLALAGIYVTNSQIVAPVTPGWRIKGDDSYLGTGSSIKAGTAMASSVVHFGHQCVVEGVAFNANALAKYGVTMDHAAFSRFSECTFKNATHDGLSIREGDVPILDNCAAIGNGIVFCSSAGVASQYDGYISANSGHDQTTVFQSSTGDPIALVVEADRHTIVANAATGTIDLTTLGLRYGDIIRLGGGAAGTPDSSSQFAQITQVLNPTTIMVAGYLRRPVAGGYADWAISRGDGIRNAGPSANNSQLVVRGGTQQFNAGSGIAIPGGGVDEVGGTANFIFGLNVNGAEPQYNGACGVLVGQQSCQNGAAPSALAGITYSVTNGSTTVTASASVDGLISPGAFFAFVSEPARLYHVASVSGVTITLAESYDGTTDGATTIGSFDFAGCAATNIKILNTYCENNAASAVKLSQVFSGEIDVVHGGTFTSANPDILDDDATVRVLTGEFSAPGVAGVGGYASRGSSEEIALGGLFSTVRNASLANLRIGFENQLSADPAAATPIDVTRSYQFITLTADLTMTATPTVAAPNVSVATTNYSQLVYIQNDRGSAGALILQDDSILAGSKLFLTSPILALPPGGHVVLMWNLYGTRYEEVSRVIPEVAISTAVDVTIKIYQRRVTVTAGGKTVTLPATPYDGEIHTVKANGAFTTTVAGNGNNIDGAATAVTASHGALTVRWNAATPEWEIV